MWTEEPNGDAFNTLVISNSYASLTDPQKKPSRLKRLPGSSKKLIAPPWCHWKVLNALLSVSTDEGPSKSSDMHKFCFPHKEKEGECISPLLVVTGWFVVNSFSVALPQVSQPVSLSGAWHGWSNSTAMSGNPTDLLPCMQEPLNRGWQELKVGWKFKESRVHCFLSWGGFVFEEKFYINVAGIFYVTFWMHRL